MTSMVFDQQREWGRTRSIGKPGMAKTEVYCAVGPLLTSILLSSARPGEEQSALSAPCSVHCFIMPTVTLFTPSPVSSRSFVGTSIGGVLESVSTSLVNFLMSLLFRVVNVPVLRFLKRYDGVANP